MSTTDTCAIAYEVAEVFPDIIITVEARPFEDADEDQETQLLNRTGLCRLCCIIVVALVSIILLLISKKK